MDTIGILLILVPALPLLAAVLTAVLGPKLLGPHSHWPALAAMLGSLVLSLLLVAHVHHAQHADHADGDGPLGSFERVYTLWTWADVGQAYRLGEPAGPAAGRLADFHIAVTLRADALTAMMLATVTFVATLVVLYSIGYMHHERGYWRYFSYISLFVFSMAMLVSVSNFVLLYVFWEAVGVCSYLLIGFWYHKPEASAAGMKAFLVNRVGDFGFALALLLIWITYGTLDFHDPPALAAADDPQAVAAAGEAVPGVLSATRIAQGEDGYAAGPVALAICLLLLLGACGKSAQFPLHVWLADAMEGPTPVSALIHAATMVTAGVYMVVRCTPLFMVSPDSQLVVAAIGAVTALLGALMALTQFDLKRILAYSTISQLGLMFLAVGTGLLSGITAGMFHLFTHAFFKALLFLGAGSVMHAMGNVIDIRRFSGLRHLMPYTHWTFLVGCLALAGVAPLAGFWSKDAILASVGDKVERLERGAAEVERREAAGTDEPVQPAVPPERTDVFGLSAGQLSVAYQLLLYLAVLTALLTAFYTFRAFYRTFYGELTVPPEAGHHAHESPPVMWVPLAILAVGAAGVGYLFEMGVPFLLRDHAFEHFLGATPSLAEGLVAETRREVYEFNITIMAVSTIVAAVGILAATMLYLGHDRELRLITRFMQTRWLFGILSPYELSQQRFYFDEIYSALIVQPVRWLAGFSYWIDRWVIDSLVDFCGRVPVAMGAVMRSLQMGLVQFYALAMVLGAVILLAAAWLR